MSNRSPGEIRDPETGKLDPLEIWYKVRAAFAVVLSLAILGGGGWLVYSKGHDVWMEYRTAEDYIGNGVDPVQVTVPKGASLAQISELLVTAKVVKTAKAFIKEAAANGDPAIAYGRYNLKTELPAKVALAMLLDPKSQLHDRITLKDGLRLSTQVTALAKATKLPEKDFNTQLKNWKKLGLPTWAKRGAEGFIFPDTYELPDKPTAASVLKQATGQFNSVADELKLEDEATVLGYSPYQVVVMASIIEKEAGLNDEDRGKIARVFYNRLAQGTKLESDATVAYANNITGRVFTTKAERELDSPYNTYLYKGLPVGPITSPSKKSLDAALHPAQGDWLFFTVVNLDTGETLFANTLDEHNANGLKLQEWCQASQANRDKCNGK
ncbi:MAG: endolytic transglycosylase MltG [Propionicimonas sp.]